MNNKDYQLLYYYEQFSNDTNLTIRIPKELKHDFQEVTGGSAYGKVLRELMVDYISKQRKALEIKHQQEHE